MTKEEAVEIIMANGKWSIKDIITIGIHIGIAVWWASSLNTQVRSLSHSVEAIAVKFEDANTSLTQMKITLSKFDDLNERIRRIEKKFEKDTL